MNPEQYYDPNTPGSSTHGSGEIQVDADSDTSRADEIETPNLQQPDLNDSSHESDNADVAIPEPFNDNQDENVVDRQMGIIGRTAG
ncbi:hypothetical protein [Fischerella sp. JS2]|uniref:hypothetical protein n=1 Tax=Fischerella sp. JS2 TaxID=2597771 RepID=UPI0028E7B3F2|nr:hypothetical protein [Fischerella sp. JS2]